MTLDLDRAARIVVFGGYGVFGSLVVRQLVANGHQVTVAGRSRKKSQSFVDQLATETVRAESVDLEDITAVERVVAQHAIAVNCAGPFQNIDLTLPRSCLAASCHYVDICDHRGYARSLRTLDQDFRARRLAGVFGCSSLPTISLALAQVARAAFTPPVNEPFEEARITLFIGNKNQKGTAAVASAVALLGKPIATTEGTVAGLTRPERIDLPQPFGRCSVLEFETPDLDLFPEQIPVSRVRVKVGFESQATMIGFHWFARWSPRLGRVVLPFIARVANRLPAWGHSGGVVRVDFVDRAGRSATAQAWCHQGGQAMAALPCSLVAGRLARKELEMIGVASGVEALGGECVLAELRNIGVNVTVVMRRIDT